MNKNYTILNQINIKPEIGGTILKSSRVNIAKIDNGPDKVFKSLNELNLSGLVVIGGEDTLSNSFYIKNFPQVLISKTIDNDVGIIKESSKGLWDIVNYFTLGFPTAAEKISSYVSLNEGLRTTAYSHERIIVLESMGMHAGWLALSSYFGQPDYIIIPEFPLDYEVLLEKVKNKYENQKNLIIVIAEGSKWKNGTHISADEGEKDSFGHPKFKGAAEVLTNNLKADLNKYLNTKNINSINPSYLYRAGKPNKLDSTMAAKLGKYAVDLISKGLNEPVFLSLQKRDNKFIVDEFYLTQIDNIEKIHRFVNEGFYDRNEFNITKEGKKYLSTIIRELPKLSYNF